MHEMAIATSIVEQAVAAAREAGAVAIETVEVEIGRMRLVVPEALEVAFTCASEGTMAEGAKLSIIEVAMLAECRSCGRQFTPEIDLYVCPGCGEADARIIAGNDMILRSLTCRTPDEAHSR